MSTLLTMITYNNDHVNDDYKGNNGEQKLDKSLSETHKKHTHTEHL